MGGSLRRRVPLPSHPTATVADWSREMLADFYAHLDEGGRATDTKRRIVEKLESCWRWLFDTEWHPSVPRPKTIEMARAVRGPVQAPTFAEMALAVDACLSEGPRRLATLLYYTGVRVEQAFAATWDQVDLDRAVWALPPHKGLPGRVVPLSKALVEELTGWGIRQGQLVSWPVSRIVRDRRLAEAWARAGVRPVVWERRQAHAFRRGLVSGLDALGAPMEDVELLVGHAVRGSRAHYLTKDIERLRTVVEMVPALPARPRGSVKSGTTVDRRNITKRVSAGDDA